MDVPRAVFCRFGSPGETAFRPPGGVVRLGYAAADSNRERRPRLACPASAPRAERSSAALPDECRSQSDTWPKHQENLIRGDKLVRMGRLRTEPQR
jgi:hypothetical protein